MRFLMMALGGILLFTACNKQNLESISPDKSLTKSAQDSIKLEIVRYIGKLPGNANYDSRFDSSFNEYYSELSDQHKIEFYHINDKQVQYFLLSRVAPSLSEKYVAIGGKLKRDQAGNIEHFEEVFRTWKLPYDEMKTTSEILMRKMIKEEDLSAYYTENQKNKYFIEFPDKDVHYNVELKRWVSKK